MLVLPGSFSCLQLYTVEAHRGVVTPAERCILWSDQVVGRRHPVVIRTGGQRKHLTDRELPGPGNAKTGSRASAETDSSNIAPARKPLDSLSRHRCRSAGPEVMKPRATSPPRPPIRAPGSARASANVGAAFGQRVRHALESLGGLDAAKVRLFRQRAFPPRRGGALRVPGRSVREGHRDHHVRVAGKPGVGHAGPASGRAGRRSAGVTTLASGESAGWRRGGRRGKRPGAVRGGASPPPRPRTRRGRHRRSRGGSRNELDGDVAGSRSAPARRGPACEHHRTGCAAPPATERLCSAIASRSRSLPRACTHGTG